MRKKIGVADVILTAVCIISAVLCLLPMLNTFAISLSSSVQAASGRVTFFPRSFTLSAYEYLLGESQFYTAFLISVERVVLGTSVNVLMMILAAFPLSHSKKTFRPRNGFMWFLVFTMMFGGGLIPTYMVVSSVGLIDKIWALILPGAVPVWNCILLMNFFRSLPGELEEASFIDGAMPVQVLYRVYLPLSLPALSTVTLFSIVGHWNEFFSGMIYLNSQDNYPLATYINALVNQAKNIMNITDPQELQKTLERSDTTLNSAKIFVSLIPILIIYPFMQKYFVTGLVMGSVKE